MKRTNLIALVLLLFCLSGIVMAQGNLENLRRWVGKYPTLRHGTVTTSFFNLPEVRQPLMKLLSRRDFNLLTREYGVETPIKQIGDFLAVKVCRAHACNTDNAGFAINLRDGSIYVRLFDNNQARWHGSSDYTTLPSEVLDFLNDFAAT